MNGRARFVAAAMVLGSLAACDSGGGGGGGGSNPGGSTFGISGVAPTSGAVMGGDLLTITGEGFAAGMTIEVGGTPCTNVVIVSDTEATCLTPAVGPSQVGDNDVVLELMTQRVTMAPGYAYLAPGFRVTSPAQSALLPSGTVAIDFEVDNFVLGDYGEGHLHFYIDGRSVGPYEFLNGATNEVHLNGAHTHFTHWTSSSSIEIYGLDASPHEVEFVLAGPGHAEYPHASARVLLEFELEAPAQGVFTTTRVLDTPGVIPTDLHFTGDGRLFYNELDTGSIRVVDTSTWQLDPVPFYTLPVRNSFLEDGLIGIELHPDFVNNGELFVSFTHSSGVGRVVKIQDVNGRGANETLILDDLPDGERHPVSKLHIGPDGMLFVSVGDGNQGTLAQDVNALNGKILRVNPNDGSAPPDNPWPGSRAYATGFRNPFGFDFHPDTGDIWMVDNGTTHDDELNIVTAGSNYGWDGTQGSLGVLNAPCCVDPIWTSGAGQVAPTALVIASNNIAYGSQYSWNVFYANNNNGEIVRVVPSGTDLNEFGGMSAAFTGGLGSIVGIAESPDGFLYISLRNGGIERVDLVP